MIARRRLWSEEQKIILRLHGLQRERYKAAQEESRMRLIKIPGTTLELEFSAAQRYYQIRHGIGCSIRNIAVFAQVTIHATEEDHVPADGSF